MENPKGLIKIRMFIKVLYDAPAALKRGSTLMVSQQTCCKISSFYSAILVFGNRHYYYFFFSTETIFPSTVGKKLNSNTLRMDLKSLIWYGIVLGVLESIFFPLLLLLFAE